MRSAELFTGSSYGYGRVEARVRFAGGDGVVGSFFLWKDGSEMPGTFWNELDYEKLGADCRLVTNAFYGNPAAVHNQYPMVNADPCGSFHVYAYEWTPDYIAWFLDGTEVRRETGATATAFAENASAGMQIRFNVWPGDASFGGNFDPAILPVHEYVDWVQYSSYANGAFTLAWREEFDSQPAGWLVGSWPSPKNLSTHDERNVNFIGGYAVLSLTADDATGPAGAMVEGAGGTSAGAGGTSAGATSSGAGGAAQSGATPTPPSSASSDSGGCSLGRRRASEGAAFAAVLGVLGASLFRRRRAAVRFRNVR